MCTKKVNKLTFRDVYTYLPLPWLSQTRYKIYNACPYKFKRSVIDGHNPEKSKKTMRQGTVLHKYFYMFFDNVDYDYLWNLGQDGHKIYKYFLKVLREMVPVKKITDPHFIRNFKAFAMFERDHFQILRLELKTKADTKNEWWCPPSRREAFIRNETFQMYGTVDRIITEGQVRIIFDYKTGTSVPKPVLDYFDEIRSGVSNEGKYLPGDVQIPNYTIQGTWYAIIDALNHGFRFDWKKKNKNGEPMWNFYRGDKKLSIGNFYEYVFLWTGLPGPKPQYFMARKKVNIRSVRAILNRLPKIRSEEDWKRKPNMKRCEWCMKDYPFYMQECKKNIEEFKLYDGENHFELY